MAPALVSRSCPLCGLGDARVLFQARDLNARVIGGDFPVARCRCGMIYLSRILENPSSAYPADYDAHAAPRVPSSLSRRFDPLKGVRPGRIVDVGCGSGRDLLALRARGWSVTGVETDPEAAAVARSAGLDVRAGGIESAGLDDGAADVVTMFHVLEHVADPVGLLRRARAALRPGGLLLAHVPNFEGWASRFFRASWYALDVPRHVNFFGARTIGRGVRQGELRLRLLRNRPAPGDWRRSAALALRVRVPSPAARAAARTACLFRGGDVLELLAIRR